MKHLNHPGPSEPSEILLEKCKKNYPYPSFRPYHVDALEHVAKNPNSLLEGHSGHGKSGICYAYLKSLREMGYKPLYFITPTKVLVRQLKTMFPDAVEAYGRNEYECLFYKDKGKSVRVEDAPCSLLKCPHRVDLRSGETAEKGAKPCPYMLAKHQALKGEIIVCTHAFFFANMHYVKSFRKNPPYCVVIDEVHRFADSVRACLTYQISDYLLRRAVKALIKVGWEYAKDLAEFLKLFVKMARTKPLEPLEILAEYEIMKLIDALRSINAEAIETGTRIAIHKGILDPVKDQKVLKTIETITKDLKWWIRELQYALPGEERKAENYVYMFFRKEKSKREKIRCALVIRHFYVSPLIRTRILPLIKRVVGCSATIGEKEKFVAETGMNFPLYQLKPIFPIENTKIYLPTDTPNLAKKNRKPGDLEKAMEMIAWGIKEFLKEGFRSLVVMPAERERNLFINMFSKDFKIMTYGEKIKAREAAELFKEREGDVLVGTLAHYAEGIDLPKNIAPVIFNLRPDYPKPQSPQAQFELRRWKSERWKIWKWRVSIRALQVRGRNQRTAEDIGLCFFISQQFRRCLKLPEWLKPALVKDKTFKECVEDGVSLLTKKLKRIP